MRPLCAALVPVILLVCSHGTTAQGPIPGYTITDVGTLGGASSSANRIDNAGRVTGQSQAANGSAYPYVWENGLMTAVPVGLGGEGFAINASGQVAGRVFLGNGIFRAFFYSAGVVTEFGDPAGPHTEVGGLSDAGTVAGYLFAAGGMRAYVWTNGVITELGTLGGTHSQAYGINNVGDVVGSSNVAGDQQEHAFLYRNGLMNDLGTLGGDFAYAMDINDAGVIVGESAITPGSSDTACFIWQNGTMAAVPLLPGATSCNALDINQLGHFVGNMRGPSGPGIPFLYRGGTLFDLRSMVADRPEWQLLEVGGINDLGQIVGVGLVNGQQRGFVLTPPGAFITPNQGDSAGGTAFQVSGAGFLAGAVVTFDDIPALESAVVDDTTITGTAPAHPTGASDVVVTNPGGAVAASLLQSFEFFDGLPALTAITPTAGRPAGGTSVIVKGARFVEGTSLHIGGLPAVDVTVVDASTIVAHTPARIAGSADVVVVNPDGGRATLASGFLFKNSAPVASELTFTAVVGQPLTGRLQAFDPDGDAMTYAAPANLGQLQVTNPATGAFTYTAFAAGPDTFVFSASDGELGSQGFVTVTALPASTPPAKLYVRYREGPTISVLNQATGALVRDLTVPGHTWRMAMSPDGTRLFVVSVSSPYGDNVATLTVFDTATDTVVGSIPLPTRPMGIALTADGRTLYVGHDTGHLTVVDTAPLSVISSQQIAGQPLAILAVTATGDKLFAMRGNGPGLVAVDTSSLAVTTNAACGGNSLATTPGGSRLYASCSSASLYLVDAATLQALEPIGVELGFNIWWTVAVSPDGRRGFALASGRLLEFDTASQAVTRQIALQTDFSFYLSADGRRAYAPDYYRSRIHVVDTTTMSLAGTFLLGDNYHFPVDVVATTPAPQSPTLYVEPTVTAFGQEAVLMARLWTTAAPVPGQTLTFRLFEQEIGTATTDAQGVARLQTSTLASVPAGTYPAAIVVRTNAPLAFRQQPATLAVRRATPSITWAPAPLILPSALGGDQLNASASVPGEFTYNPPAGAILQLGGENLIAAFAPFDDANYRSVQRQQEIAVNYATDGSAPQLAGIVAGVGSSVEIALDGTSGMAYMADAASGAVKVVDVRAATIDETWPLTAGAGTSRAIAVAIDAGRQRLYALSGPDSYALWILETTSGSVLEVVPLNSPAYSVVVNARTGVVYMGGPQVTAFDPALVGASRLAAVASPPGNFIALEPDAGVLMVSGNGTTLIGVDPAQPGYHATLGTLPITGPVAVNRRTKRGVVAVSGYFVATLKAIDLDRGSGIFGSVVASTDLTAELRGSLMDPLSVAVNPVTGLAYVAMSDIFWNSTGAATVTTVDLANGSQRAITVQPSLFGSQSIIRVAVDPGSGRVVAVGSFELRIFEDRRAAELATPPDAVVSPVMVAASEATLTFSDVTAGGTTTIDPVDPSSINLTVPGQFTIDDALAYQITTTATVVPPITVCFNVASVDDPAIFDTLRVLHGEGGLLVDRTSSRNFATGSLCAIVPSLSPFVIARQVGPLHGVRVLHDATKPHKSGSTVPLKIQVLNLAGSNISSQDLAVLATSVVRTSHQTTGTPVDSGNANADYNFRFTGFADGGGYIFNLSTRNYASGSYSLRFRIGDDASVYEVPFQVK